MADPTLEDERSPVRWVSRLLPALPPLVWMTAILLGGSRLQWNDYWFMVDRTFTENGLIDLGGLFTFQNEHPIVLPQLVYWLNAQLTGGSNLALGVFVVALVAAQIALVARFVPEGDWRRAGPFVLVAAAGALLFARQGLHNFWLAMSGTAWLLANLLVLAAVLARVRGRVALAIGLGVAASMTYGTGLMVWPALLVTGMVQDRRRRPEPAVLAATVLVALAYFALRDPVPDAGSPGLWQWVRATMRIGGSVIAGSLGASEVVGAVVIVAGIVLCVLAVRSARPELVPWVGVFTFALGSCVLIARSRFLWVVYFGHQSRYASLSALLVLSAAALAAAFFRFRLAALAPLAVLGVAAVLHGQAEVDRERANLPAQEEFAAALRLDLADGQQYALWVAYPRVAPLLDRIDHYPFDGHYDGDCGLAGQVLPRAGSVSREEGHLDQAQVLTNGRGLRLLGWLPEDRPSPVRCVVIVDELNRVVGFGPPGAGGREAEDAGVDRDRAFAAVVPVGASRFRAYAVQEDGALFRLNGALEAPITAPVPAAPLPELPSLQP